MQFTVSSSLLNSQLQTLVKVINSKSSMPILDCFLFEVSNGKLVVTASDKENVMSAELPIEGCDGECIIGIPNRNILDAVKEHPLAYDIFFNLKSTLFFQYVVE